VKRTIRSNNAPDSNPRPGPPGRGRRYGVRLKRSNDAAQLLTREKLRRVERHRERSKRNGREPRGGSKSIPRERRAPQRAGRRKPDGPAFTAGQQADRHRTLPCLGRRKGRTRTDSEDRKHGEPQDRQQGATNLQSARWSKPSKSGGTARAERVRDVAAPGRKWTCARPRSPSGRRATAALRSSRTTGSGHQAPKSMEGRISDNPKRGVRQPHGREKHDREVERRAHHG
jgi:hypothetical protein